MANRNIKKLVIYDSRIYPTSFSSVSLTHYVEKYSFVKGGFSCCVDLNEKKHHNDCKNEIEKPRKLRHSRENLAILNCFYLELLFYLFSSKQEEKRMKSFSRSGRKKLSLDYIIHISLNFLFRHFTYIKFF